MPAWIKDEKKYSTYLNSDLTGVGVPSTASYKLGLDFSQASRINQEGVVTLKVIARVWAKKSVNLLNVYCIDPVNDALGEKLLWFPVWRGTTIFKQMRDIQVGSVITAYFENTDSISMPLCKSIDE